MNIIELPEIKFKFDDFDNYIDSLTMEIHYKKHHLSYINNLNYIFKKIGFSYNNDKNVIDNLSLFPKKYRIFIKNNIGGHINHSMFWNILGYNSELSKNLLYLINYSFKNINNFKKIFKIKMLNHFGSGWIWLVYNINSKKLNIITTKNQDNPTIKYNIKKITCYPILLLDLWEHAYYLKYKNDKLSYLNSFWNIINWNYVSYKLDNILLNKFNI